MLPRGSNTIQDLNTLVFIHCTSAGMYILIPIFPAMIKIVVPIDKQCLQYTMQTTIHVEPVFNVLTEKKRL